MKYQYNFCKFEWGKDVNKFRKRTTTPSDNSYLFSNEFASYQSPNRKKIEDIISLNKLNDL